MVVPAYRLEKPIFQFCMITLKKDEKILLTLHKHWYAIINKLAIILFLGMIPLLIIPFSPDISDYLRLPSITPIIILFSSIYWLIIILLFYIEWLDYWLDVWVVTNRRIVDVEQTGIFTREVSEFVIDRCQDVTIQIPGLLATFFQYGNLTVHTAGETSFTAFSVPHLEHAKNLILRCAEEERVRKSSHLE
jgi:uncharacterized membrane protein YdbT with pleckstrin-like domain